MAVTVVGKGELILGCPYRELQATPAIPTEHSWGNLFHILCACVYIFMCLFCITTATL